MPDEDEMPVETPIAPRTLKDMQRGLSNDAIWRQQAKIASSAANATPTQQVLNLVGSLTTALNGIGTVSTDCRTAGQGPIYISLSLSQATALITKLTTGILGL